MHPQKLRPDCLQVPSICGSSCVGGVRRLVVVRRDLRVGAAWLHGLAAVVDVAGAQREETLGGAQR